MTWFTSGAIKRCSSSLFLCVMSSTKCRRCSMFSCFSVCVAIWIVFGLRKIWCAIRPILPSNVAENKSVWRSAGNDAHIRSTSGIKPMSNIRSASSKINICKRDISIRPRSMWSNRRPGVATKISNGCESNLFWSG